MNKLYLLSVLTALYSCQNFFKSEVELPERYIQPQLVVHGYISPQNSENKVSVSLSQPIFGGQSYSTQPVSDAQVILRNSANQSAFLVFNNAQGYYIISSETFPIVSGETYHLEVTDRDGRHTTAQCTVPLSITQPIDNIQIIKTQNTSLQEAFQLAFNFQDAPDIRNYYIAEAWVDTDNGHFKRKAEIKPFTDNHRDGQQLSVLSEHTPGSAESIEQIEVTLLSVDDNYYQYVKTVLLQSQTQSLGAFAEPVFINTNIKGGLGVFGAYSQKSISIKP